MSDTTCINVMDGRFALVDGEVYSHHMGYDRYGRHLLDVFDNVTIAARAFPSEPSPNLKKVTGPGVKFVVLPSYNGLLGFLTAIPRLLRELNLLLGQDAVFLARVPGAISSIFTAMAWLKRIEFCVECVADPADQLAKGSVRHFLRPILRSLQIKAQRWQCRQAAAATYVTQRTLQARYPAKDRSREHSWTDIVLGDESFVLSAKSYWKNPSAPIRIVSVGMMIQLYKGQDDLLKAISILVARGQPCHLLLVGDGKYRVELEHMAVELGVSESVTFLGQMEAGSAVRKVLDSCDIFCLPSRQEGLPRALLEAMARGMLCVTTDVGGMPELISREAMVPPNSPELLASRIESFAHDGALSSHQATLNLAESKNYHFSSVRSRREMFYQRVAGSRDS